LCSLNQQPSTIQIEGLLVGAEEIGEREFVDAHGFELGVGLEPEGIGAVQVGLAAVLRRAWRAGGRLGAVLGNLGEQSGQVAFGLLAVGGRLFDWRKPHRGQGFICRSDLIQSIACIKVDIFNDSLAAILFHLLAQLYETKIIGKTGSTPHI